MAKGNWKSAFVETDPSGLEDPDAAAAALKHVSRNEQIKSYVQSEKPIHDVLLGTARRFIGGERLDECLQAAQKVTHSGYAVTIDYMG